MIRTFNQLDKSVGQQIRTFYKSKLTNGEDVDVLYYFWVKIVCCPSCKHQVELFKNRVFVKNAYPDKHPRAKALCPNCYAINNIIYNDVEAVCNKCQTKYNPQKGNVCKSKVTCPSCNSVFSVIDAVRKFNFPPKHKMFAKMVLHKDGKKSYQLIDTSDEYSSNLAKKMLNDLWDYIPKSQIEPGYNTNQILKYNYKYWYQLFDDRQLVYLSLLVLEIKKIENPQLRILFACLFSGMLEFNNLFASFKGEGTGAVRHMFSHHILKPETVPLDGNIWGTSKSSGSFSTLFQTRILRALEYKEKPFELKITNSKEKYKAQKVYGISKPINTKIVDNYKAFLSEESAYLSIGNSSSTDIYDESIDLIITDPPFFENIHYSQLADFFYVWIRQIIELESDGFSRHTTRSPYEVQNSSSVEFVNRLSSVLLECYRVLKKDGLLVLTYHHARGEGWIALYTAIRKAGFLISFTHPIKSEMSVAVPIQQSSKPINYDLILVCRKSIQGQSQPKSHHLESSLFVTVTDESKNIIEKLRNASLQVSIGDIRVILMGCLFKKLWKINDLSKEQTVLGDFEEKIDLLIEKKISEG